MILKELLYHKKILINILKKKKKIFHGIITLLTLKEIKNIEENGIRIKKTGKA
jgi:hypothetical protein